MDFDGFWWILMDFDGFWWILMDFDGFWWISLLGHPVVLRGGIFQVVARRRDLASRSVWALCWLAEHGKIQGKSAFVSWNMKKIWRCFSRIFWKNVEEIWDEFYFTIYFTYYCHGFYLLVHTTNPNWLVGGLPIKHGVKLFLFSTNSTFFGVMVIIG